MFQRPTVFILGAGASWHYGFPTGERLVAQAINKAKDVSAFFQESAYNANGHMPAFFEKYGSGEIVVENPIRLWERARDSMEQLATRLSQVNPTIIDYFLEQNPDLHDVGTLVIAMVLLDCEYVYSQRGNQNRRELYEREIKMGTRAPMPGGIDERAFADDWLRFILYKLTSNCEDWGGVLRNRVTFVSFNYDLSLERRLQSGFENISRFAGADVAQFFSDERFVHVYGKLGETPVSIRSTGTFLPRDFRGRDDLMRRGKEIIDAAFEASKGIRVIGGIEKESERRAIDHAGRAIGTAEYVYILGYGFDNSNSRRLQLLEHLRGSPQRNRYVMFTNFGGQNRISKAASRLMFDQHDQFIRTPTHFRQTGSFSYLWEMSTRNVYDALAEDFESLETL